MIENPKLNERKIRIVKKVRYIYQYRYVDEVRKLEFLIDQEGNLDDIGVYDFKNDMYYQTYNCQEKSQLEVLNSIYEQVKLELEEEVNVKQNSNKFGKCKTLTKK